MKKIYNAPALLVVELRTVHMMADVELRTVHMMAESLVITDTETIESSDEILTKEQTGVNVWDSEW